MEESPTGQPTLGAPDEGVARLRANSIGTLAALVAEYILGTGVNIFVKVPDADAHSGTFGAFAKAVSNGPAALAAHAVFGILLAVGSISIVVRALMIGRLSVTVSSAVALLAMFGASFSGAGFVDKGQNSASMTMAVLAGVAMFCLALNLYPLPAARRDSA